MSILFYVRLVGFAAGAILHLFVLSLIAGHRRPRRFDRILFLLLLALFLFYSGGLLVLNAHIHYASPPRATLIFALGLVGLGLAFVPPLLFHAHAELDRLSQGEPWRPWLRLTVICFYLPLAYFAFVLFPEFVRGDSLEVLWPGSSAGMFYGCWLAASLLASAVLERQATRKSADLRQQWGLYRFLMFYCGMLGFTVLYTYGLGGPRNPAWAGALSTAITLSALVPTALLGYFALRYNFLEIGVQRNLVYAVSAAFLALLYLALVHRVSGWLEPILPPEATASILLFVLVVFFEPMERGIGRTLYRTIHQRMDRLQQLSLEIQQEARHGDLKRLIAFVEGRLREEFGLAAVRISIPRDPSAAPLRPAGGLGHSFEVSLRRDRGDIGALEVCSSGAVLTGETTAELEFLAERFPAVVELCRLIEEKIKLERELAERERLALVGQMAASISHNLRNPLSSMKTVLQVLLERRNLPEDVREDCGLVVGEIDRLSAKLSQLLEYAKPTVRSPGRRPAVGGVDAVGLAEQVVALLRRDAERRRVKLDLDRPLEEVRILGTEGALSDVVSNLVVNAIEAQPADGRVRVSLRQTDGRFVIEVTDDGPGIPSDLRSKILQPFFTTKPSGTGLGLAIVARRLAEMEGTIVWDSPVNGGRGTKFTVSLPLAD